MSVAHRGGYDVLLCPAVCSSVCACVHVTEPCHSLSLSKIADEVLAYWLPQVLSEHARCVLGTTTCPCVCHLGCSCMSLISQVVCYRLPNLVLIFKIGGQI